MVFRVWLTIGCHADVMVAKYLLNEWASEAADTAAANRRKLEPGQELGQVHGYAEPHDAALRHWRRRRG